MVQTLVKERNLATMPQDLDLLVVDEAHHVAAASYMRIIEEFKDRNPEGHILGLTATPQRSDRKALISVFPTVADIIQLGELVQGGFLVKPRGIVMDLGLKAELDRIPKTSDFDMDEVAEVMDKSPLNDRIVREWKQHAGKRQTVVFTATVAHAEHMCESFTEAGVAAVVVHAIAMDLVRDSRHDGGTGCTGLGNARGGIRACQVSNPRAKAKQKSLAGLVSAALGGGQHNQGDGMNAKTLRWLIAVSVCLGIGIKVLRLMHR